MEQNINLPYRFYEFWVPKYGIYKDESNQWTNLIGNFIKPIVEDEPNLIYWFVQEGRWFQFCFASNEPEKIASKIRMIQKKVRIKTKRILKGDMDGALGGTRWVSTKRLKDKRIEAKRSELMLRVCHSVCKLYIHSLEKRGKHWMTEISGDLRQNTHGNLFESLIHLIANISQAQFDVQIYARTGWMQDYQKTKITCHL